MKKKYNRFDEAFKELMKDYFEPFARVITDYELLDMPKRVDLLIIEINEPISDYVKIFTYFKRFNIIEFKSEKDRFVFKPDLYNIGIYINGVILKEIQADYTNSSFTLVSTLKPTKLLKYFQANEIEKGLYKIENLSITPIHVVVIEEIDKEYEKDITILKEFTSKKDRYEYLGWQIKNINENKNEFDKLFNLSLELYTNDIINIYEREGLNMTQSLKNIEKLAEWSGLKRKYRKEGKNYGLRKGIERGMEKAFLETIKNALLLGVPEDVITKMTGFDIEKINEIRNNIN
jgi:hypothetical protein